MATSTDPRIQAAMNNLLREFGDGLKQAQATLVLIMEYAKHPEAIPSIALGALDKPRAEA